MNEHEKLKRDMERSHRAGESLEKAMVISFSSWMIVMVVMIVVSTIK